VRIEGGPDADGDRHALLVDRRRCRLYELFVLRREGGRWSAGSGATWRRSALRRSCRSCWPRSAHAPRSRARLNGGHRGMARTAGQRR
jgi:hypothetical protein